MGCSGAITADHDQHQCLFARTGFEDKGVQFLPCGTTYHVGCIRVGEPFRTRLRKEKGLSFPKIGITPHFICEACTVRAMLGRELVKTPEDQSLLMLERMRMIDQACSWDPSTLKGYQSHLRRIRRFETQYGVTGLVPTYIQRPPTSPSIVLMWAQQKYALETPKKSHARTQDRVTYGTARALRSAASQFYTWDMQIAHPGLAMRDSQRRGFLTPGCLPTDELGYTLMTTGMARRMGDESVPSVALHSGQVMRIVEYLDDAWDKAHTLGQRRDLAAAAVTHIGFWLTWLRSNEFFALTWDDVEVTPPEHYAKHGLPNDVGVVEMTLLPETKSDRTKVADVVVAYTTRASGLSLGTWIDRMKSLWPDTEGDARFIRGSDGQEWTSHYYRMNFLYPWLEQLKREGDVTLRAFSDDEGNTIPDKYYSMNSYRRGGRSHVSKRRAGKREGTETEIYEHGRWRYKRQLENMPTRYREFTLEDRIYVTLLCM